MRTAVTVFAPSPATSAAALGAKQQQRSDAHPPGRRDCNQGGGEAPGIPLLGPSSAGDRAVCVLGAPERPGGRGSKRAQFSRPRPRPIPTPRDSMTLSRGAQ